MTGPKTAEVPTEFVMVTVTAVNGTVVPGGPVKVNCTVMVNVLPKGIEAELPYQPVNALVSGTVTSAELNCVFVGDVKWKRALVMSRGVERPVTEMLNPLVVTVPIVTLVMNGTVGPTAMTIRAGGGSTLPAESCKLVSIFIFPATVPIMTGILVNGVVLNNPWLVPAAIVKVAVVAAPLANFAS